MQASLPLALPENPHLAEFIVSPANETAFMLASGSITVPSNLIFVEGAAGSGKTHLLQLWADHNNAAIIDAERELAKLSVIRNNSHIAVDNIDKLPPETLFHIINHINQCNGKLFATACHAPKAQQFKTADIASRLGAAHYVTIDKPDDFLLKSLLFKQLTKHQIRLTPHAMDYLLKRIHRNYRTILDLPDKIAYHVMVHGVKPTQEVLSGLLQSS